MTQEGGAITSLLRAIKANGLLNWPHSNLNSWRRCNIALPTWQSPRSDPLRISCYDLAVDDFGVEDLDGCKALFAATQGKTRGLPGPFHPAGHRRSVRQLDDILTLWMRPVCALTSLRIMQQDLVSTTTQVPCLTLQSLGRKSHNHSRNLQGTLSVTSERTVTYKRILWHFCLVLGCF